MIKAANFMMECLDQLSQSILASRLSINCAPSKVDPSSIDDLPMTIMDVWDESALSEQVREDLLSAYPKAKKAHLKTGGNFPFLSRCEEVDLHIMIHLRNFDQGVL